LSHRLSGAYVTRLRHLRHTVETLSIKSPRQVIMERAQRLDDIGRTMNIILSGRLNAARTVLLQADRLPVLLSNKLTAVRQSVLHVNQMLNSLSYKNVLQRGYAIVRYNNKIISHAADFKTPAEIEFADGTAVI